MSSVVLGLAFVLLTTILHQHSSCASGVTSDFFSIDRDLSIDNRALLRETDAPSLVECAAECGSHACCLTALFKPETETTGSCSLHSTRKLNVETYFESSSVLMYKESSDALASYQWECTEGYIKGNNILPGISPVSLSECKEFCLRTEKCFSLDYDIDLSNCFASEVTKDIVPGDFEAGYARSNYCELKCFP
ncbi:hypothetical protein CAPTEDRAFT_225199 [Capitella teleta]|uniref:Apple domain-containing protein n=1 Tax=Capitella teleta TaxID=283909 RepID=R7TTG1_CAPTE|nr:hypothetical protein CAPTEDRAFT_225199 [Capitella teleta]|eukprot:ELT94761.1 hypothetical protein CAPTEDRAFT_225199 [Capitella teleta]